MEEAHHHREDRVNEILFTITLVTSIFVPANFIAAVVRCLDGLCVAFSVNDCWNASTSTGKSQPPCKLTNSFNPPQPNKPDQFGMNMQYDGKPNIPELTWKRGYLWFWLWCFLTSAGVVWLVKFQMSMRARQWK